MKLLGGEITLKAKDKEWGFTEASLPRYHKGSDFGVLICHGLGGTPANMRCLYDEAVSLGFSVAMPLLKGHAATLGAMASYGYRDWQQDVEDAFQRLVEMGCTRISLCGLSMGALLMADLAAKKRDTGLISSAMLICPPIRFRGYLNVMRRLAPIMPYAVTADSFEHTGTEIYCGTASRKLGDVMKLSSIVRREAKQIDLPLLMIEAENDNRVAPVSFGILKKLFPEAGYAFIKGAPHGVTYSPQAKDAVELFRAFFTDNR